MGEDRDGEEMRDGWGQRGKKRANRGGGKETEGVEGERRHKRKQRRGRKRKGQGKERKWGKMTGKGEARKGKRSV